MQVDKPSCKYTVKAEMILWLWRQEVACVAPKMKPHLYKLIEPEKKKKQKKKKKRED
jgi:hypothetical protein